MVIWLWPLWVRAWKSGILWMGQLKSSQLLSLRKYLQIQAFKIHNKIKPIIRGRWKYLEGNKTARSSPETFLAVFFIILLVSFSHIYTTLISSLGFPSPLISAFHLLSWLSISSSPFHFLIICLIFKITYPWPHTRIYNVHHVRKFESNKSF